MKESLKAVKSAKNRLFSAGRWTSVKTSSWRRKRKSWSRHISGSAATKCKEYSAWTRASSYEPAVYRGGSVDRDLALLLFPLYNMRCFRVRNGPARKCYNEMTEGEIWAKPPHINGPWEFVRPGTIWELLNFATLTFLILVYWDKLIQIIISVQYWLCGAVLVQYWYNYWKTLISCHIVCVGISRGETTIRHDEVFLVCLTVV